MLDHDYSLAAFDLDGTLLRTNSCFEFLKFLYSTKKITFARFCSLACYYVHHKVFFTSYQNLHHSTFDRFFRGMPISFFEDCLEEFLEQHLSSFIYEPAFSCLQDLQNKKVPVFLLSNSPYFIVNAIGERLGIDKVFGTSYILDNEGILCEIETLMDGEKKKEVLKELTLSAESKKVVAFSNGIYDLPFLLEADLPICVKPDRKLKKIARENNWKIL